MLHKSIAQLITFMIYYYYRKYLQGGDEMIKRTTYSIEEQLLADFKETCKKNSINQSSLIASMMKEVIKKFKREDKK